MKFNSLPRLSCALALLASASSSYGALGFQTIDMALLGQGNAAFNTPSVPFGSPTILGGVPFIVTDGANQVWAANTAAGQNAYPVSVTFQMPVNNIYGFYTLANLFWGDIGQQTTEYRFHFTDGTDVSVKLTNGVDLRDFNDATWANTINGTTTVNVADEPYRLDRQWIDLDALGAGGKDLETFSVFDTGSYGHSRVYVVAATAQVGEIGQQVPEATSAMLTAFAGLALAIRRRR